MTNQVQMNRRQFVQKTAIGSAALTFGLSAATLVGAADPYRGLKMGLASISFRDFTLDQGIVMTKELGVRGLALRQAHLPMTSTPAELKEAAKKIKDAGLELLGVGVVNMKNEEDVRSAFDYAKGASVPTIVCSPAPELLDAVEKCAVEYKIRIAIHNHGPGDKKYPSLLDALKAVQDRHELMGLCLDVGHTARLGENPVEVLQKCSQRLYDFHMKDVTEATANGKPCIVGKGVIDVPAVLKSLVNMKFPYHVALEYETDRTAPMPGMKAAFEYMRKVLV